MKVKTFRFLDRKGVVLWESPPYVVNMFYYNWLIKKLFWPVAGQNRARQEKTEWWEKKAESERHHAAAKEDRCPRTLPVNHESFGNL